MVKEGKILTMATPWSASVTKCKGLGKDKHENKDLLPVIWLVTPESKIEGPGEEDWVRLAKYTCVCHRHSRTRILLILIPFWEICWT